MVLVPAVDRHARTPEFTSAVMIVPASVAWRTLISCESSVIILAGSEKRKKLEKEKLPMFAKRTRAFRHCHRFALNRGERADLRLLYAGLISRVTSAYSARSESVRLGWIGIAASINLTGRSAFACE
jgi:hypothetical protein